LCPPIQSRLAKSNLRCFNHLINVRRSYVDPRLRVNRSPLMILHPFVRSCVRQPLPRRSFPRSLGTCHGSSGQSPAVKRHVIGFVSAPLGIDVRLLGSFGVNRPSSRVESGRDELASFCRAISSISTSGQTRIGPFWVRFGIGDRHE
jgi:hypothetical protein